MLAWEPSHFCMDHPSRTFKPDAYRQKIQELLANLPERAQVAIAARCAWRVMPLLAGSSQKWELKPLRDIAAAASVAALIGDGFDRYAAYGLSAARAASAAISSNIPESPLSVSDFAASGAGSSASLAAFAAFVAFGSVTTDAASIILRTTANAARTVALIANSLYKKDDFDLFLIEVLQSTESDIQRISSFPGDDKFGTSFHFLYDGEVPQGIVNAWRQSCEKLGDAGDEIFRLWESFYRGRVNWPEVGDFFLRWLHERENSDDRPSTANNAVPPEATDPLPKPSPSEPPSPPPKPPGFRFDSDPAGIAPDSPQGDIQGRALECCLALRDFLLHKNTAAPLTVAVEAPWGAGKSSVMLCLRNHLETKKIPTVWFNPWQYEAGKALWAAFALAFERQLAGRYLPPRRFWKRASLAVRRMTGKEWIIFVFHLAAWGLIFAALWWLLNHNWTGQDKDGRAMSWEQVLSNLFAPNSWQGHAVKGLIALAVFLPFLKEIVAKLGSPFKSELSKLYGSGSYTEQMGELYRFHEDFRRMLFSYAPGVRLRYLQAYLSWWFRKVLAKLRRKKWEEGTFPHPEAPKIVVFIDDLDRCEAPKVAELLQSLHLMMNGDESGNLRPHWGITRWLLTHWNNLKKRLGWQFKPPGLFYILGMDREKVAAAVAAKHAALLPLLEDPDKNGKISRAQAMHFGREYLEKFVHLTLHLPAWKALIWTPLYSRSAV